MSANRSESIAILTELLASARFYAADTDSHIGSPMALNPLTPDELRSFQALADSLSFTSGSGRQVSDGTYSWKTWASQFQGLVAGMLEWRSEQGYPPLSDVDPMVTWWGDVAAPQLETISVGEFIETATAPVKELGKAGAGLLEFGTPLVVAIVVILVLVIVAKVV